MDRQGRVYDVLLLGSGLGGLIAGALLARKSRSVLLIQEKRHQPVYRHKEYRFVPFSSFSEKRLRPSLLRGLYKVLGMARPEGKGGDGFPSGGDAADKEPASFYQVILPEARLDLFGETALQGREWKREFPQERQQIETLYQRFHQVHDLLESKEKKIASPFFPAVLPSFWNGLYSRFRIPGKGVDGRLDSFSWEFRKFMELQLGSWGNLQSDTFPFELMAYLLGRQDWGRWAPDLDSVELAERVMEVFLDSGGEVEEIGRVEHVTHSWRRGIEISPEADRRRFRGRRLILNGPLHSFSTLFGNRGRFLSRWMDCIQPRYLLVPMFLGVREKVCPEGMGELLVSVQDLNKTDEGGNRLMLALSEKGDRYAAPEGRRALLVQTLIPYRGREHIPVNLKEAIIGHLNQIIPFLDHYLEFVEFEWGLDQIKYGSYPHYLYETNVPFDWRRGIVPTRLSRDLFFTGKENFPYLGVEGEILSGRIAAARIGEGGIPGSVSGGNADSS